MASVTISSIIEKPSGIVQDIAGLHLYNTLINSATSRLRQLQTSVTPSLVIVTTIDVTSPSVKGVYGANLQGSAQSIQSRLEVTAASSSSFVQKFQDVSSQWAAARGTTVVDVLADLEIGRLVVPSASAGPATAAPAGGSGGSAAGMDMTTIIAIGAGGGAALLAIAGLSYHFAMRKRSKVIDESAVKGGSAHNRKTPSRSLNSAESTEAGPAHPVSAFDKLHQAVVVADIHSNRQVDVTQGAGRTEDTTEAEGDGAVLRIASPAGRSAGASNPSNGEPSSLRSPGLFASQSAGFSARSDGQGNPTLVSTTSNDDTEDDGTAEMMRTDPGLLEALASGFASTVSFLDAVEIPIIKPAIRLLKLGMDHAAAVRGLSTHVGKVEHLLRSARTHLLKAKANPKLEQGYKHDFTALVAAILHCEHFLNKLRTRSGLAGFAFGKADDQQLSTLEQELGTAVKHLATATQFQAVDTLQTIDSRLQLLAQQKSTARLLAGVPEYDSFMSFRSFDFYEGGLAKQLAVAKGGAYGSVVRGHWKKAKGLAVAIKVMRGDQDGSAKRSAKWYHEVASMKKLRDSNPKHVVLLYGSGRDVTPDNLECYLVGMEFMGGGSLREFLDDWKRRTHKQLKLDWALQWCLHVALGVQECHKVGIVHGDIKADNVLLSEPDETRFRMAKLGDFGGSRIRQSFVTDELSMNSVKAAQQDGTKAWQAPEILKNSKEERTTFASDVYAWAITAWEVLSCCVPYAETDDVGRPLHDVEDLETLVKIYTNTLRPSMALLRDDLQAAGIHNQLVALLQAAWAGDVAARPTMAKVVESLQSIIAVARKG